MQESNITDLVSFNQQFKNFNEINLIGLDCLQIRFSISSFSFLDIVNYFTLFM